MSDQGKAKMDLRVVKTKENLHNALIMLMKVKNIKDITVQDICTEARCSRNTFYNHYAYKENLYEEVLDMVFAHMEMAFTPIVYHPSEMDDKVIAAYVENIFQNFKEVGDIIKAMVSMDAAMAHQKLFELVYKSNMRMAPELIEEDGPYEIKLYLKYLLHGVTAFMIECITNPQCSEKEAKTYLYNIHQAPVKMIGDKMLKYL